MNKLRSCITPLLVAIYLTTVMFASAASAEIVDTRSMIETDAREAKIEHVQELLSQDEVEKQMITLGVDPEDARQRVAALTDDQLDQIDSKLQSAPAGAGALAVIGAVFVVLLVLELVGVVNIFSRI